MDSANIINNSYLMESSSHIKEFQKGLNFRLDLL